MGANAQTTVPTFTASQVLTADQQNQSARTGVPVFATTVTRDAGFGGTGEKTLAEGQLCYVEGTGLQTYNGTSWVTWGTSLATGLRFIASQSYTASATINVNNVFSSTYRNYLILVNNDGGGNEAGNLRLRVGGSDNSTANSYKRERLSVASGSVTGNALTATSIQILMGSSDPIGQQIWVFNPAVAVETSFHCHSGINGNEMHVYYGNHNQLVAYDGFTMLYTNNQTGTLEVYGYAIS